MSCDFVNLVLSTKDSRDRQRRGPTTAKHASTRTEQLYDHRREVSLEQLTLGRKPKSSRQERFADLAQEHKLPLPREKRRETLANL